MKSLVVELSLITALEFMYIQNDEFIGVFIEEKVQAFEQFSQRSACEHLIAVKGMKFSYAQPVLV
ncbi:hypothetical protein D9M71_806850 [compost metagenome]